MNSQIFGSADQQGLMQLKSLRADERPTGKDQSHIVIMSDLENLDPNVMEVIQNLEAKNGGQDGLDEMLFDMAKMMGRKKDEALEMRPLR